MTINRLIKKNMINHIKASYNEELESLQSENEKQYAIMIEHLNDIRTDLDVLHNVEVVEISRIGSIVNDISNHAYEIESYVKVVKNNGISNEDALYKGKDSIEKLESEFQELLSELEYIGNNSSDLNWEIDHLKDQIRDIENEIKEKYSVESSTNKRLISHGGKSVFICDVHDEIKACAQIIEDDCSLLNDAMDDETISEELIETFINEVGHHCTDVENNISEAKDMNEHMGNGISTKNSKIFDLTVEIKDLEKQIEIANNEHGDLEGLFEELEETLNDLKKQL